MGAAAAVCAALALPARADLVWHWEDRFPVEEQARLAGWITTVANDVERAVAPFPFDVHIHFYRVRATESPVPWANTRRSAHQGVNIYVDPAFPREELLADWTAYHELSHLFLPYLGRRHSWFAEGFASYMQYQVMVAAGVMTDAEMRATYRDKISSAMAAYDLPDRTFIEAVPVLRARREYRTAYWGGAVYFLAVDRELRENGSSVITVVREFVHCCRAQDHGLDSLVDELDRIAENDAFSRQLAEFRTRKGFPDYPDT